MNKVSFAPRGLVDYETVARWYHQQHPEINRHFHMTMNDYLKHLVASPRLHPRLEHGTRRAFLHRFPYALYYVERTDGIHVVAIVHGRRRPDTWSAAFDVEGKSNEDET